MTERKRPPTDRSSVLKRQLAANAFWGVDSNSHCHDVPPRSTPRPVEVTEDGDYYVVAADTKTGEFTIKPDSE
jgi:hypothetical protein